MILPFHPLWYHFFLIFKLFFVGHVSVRALPVDGAHLRRAVALLPVAETRSCGVRRSRLSPAHRSVQLDLHRKTNEEISGWHITVTYLILNLKQECIPVGCLPTTAVATSWAEVSAQTPPASIPPPILCPSPCEQNDRQVGMRSVKMF